MVLLATLHYTCTKSCWCLFLTPAFKIRGELFLRIFLFLLHSNKRNKWERERKKRHSSNIFCFLQSEGNGQIRIDDTQLALHDFCHDQICEDKLKKWTQCMWFCMRIPHARTHMCVFIDFSMYFYNTYDWNTVGDK